MPHRSTLIRSSLCTAILILAAGCSTKAQPSLAREQSVKPGINDSYRDPDPAQFVERFEREGREIYELRHQIVEACAIPPGSDVADVGAGTGLFEPLLADAVGPDGTVWAVDIVPRFLELIRTRAGEQGIENIRVMLCTERSVELPDASVDVVFVCDTYHHFEYPQNTMSSIRSALRPGGELIIVDFRRVPGVSSDWILEHVRAGLDVVRSEIESFGFEFVEEVDLLESNYFVRFRRGA